MAELKIRSRGKPHLHIGKIEKGLQPGAKKAMGKVARILRKQVRFNLAGAVLQMRSGHLRRSYEDEIQPTIDGYKLSAGFDLTIVPYARIHELGGMAGRGKSVKIPKRPYLRKALAEKKVEIRDVVKDFAGKLIR